MVVSSKSDKVKSTTFHPAERTRSWQILRHHVNLDVDLQTSAASGIVTLTLYALNDNRSKVAINLVVVTYLRFTSTSDVAMFELSVLSMTTGYWPSSIR